MTWKAPILFTLEIEKIVLEPLPHIQVHNIQIGVESEEKNLFLSETQVEIALNKGEGNLCLTHVKE